MAVRLQAKVCELRPTLALYVMHSAT